MTYEEAKSIALNYNSAVNACYEYDKGYYFYVRGIEADGGGYDFVVVKETGKCVSMASFICDYHPNSKRKRIKF